MENSENTVSLGKAIGIIAFVLTITIVLFVAPVQLSLKLYFYIFALVIPLYFILKKQYSKESSLNIYADGKLWEKLSGAGKLSFVYIGCFVAFCGTIQFFMYYFGNSTSFIDITLYYIGFATPLVIHWIYKLVKEKEEALQYIFDIFSLWLIGYCLIWVSIFFWWFIMYESDL
jgi:hypothetical protein